MRIPMCFMPTDDGEPVAMVNQPRINRNVKSWIRFTCEEARKLRAMLMLIATPPNKRPKPPNGQQNSCPIIGASPSNACTTQKPACAIGCLEEWKRAEGKIKRPDQRRGGRDGRFGVNWSLSFEIQSQALKMPRGGRRANAGRKPGSKPATRSREIANEAVVRGARLPLEYMLAVLADENAPQARRDMMAVQAAPFAILDLRRFRRRLSLAAMVAAGATSCLMCRFSRCRVELIDRSGVVTIEGEATELKPISPFEGSPPLRLRRSDAARAARAPRGDRD